MHRLRVPLALLVLTLVAPQGAFAFHEDDDCGSGGDAGWREKGLPLTLPATCSGLAGFSDLDTYVAEVSEQVVLRLVRAEAAPLTLLTIERAPDVAASAGTIGPSRLALHVAPGTWYATIRDFAGGHRPYSLAFDTFPFADSPDCGAAGDSPDAFGFGPWPAAGAPAIASPGTCSGTLDVGDASDVVTFATDGTSAVRVRVEADGPVSAVLASTDGFIDRRLSGSGVLETAAADSAPREWVLRVTSPRPLHEEIAVSWSAEVALEPLPAGDDCGAGVDLPAYHAGGAYPLVAAGASCAAAREPADAGDAYAAEKPAGHAVARLTYTGPSGTRMFIDTPSDRAFARAGDGPAQLYLTGREDALSLLAYRHEGGAPGAYSFSYDLLPDLQDDCGAGHDAAADRAHAVDVHGSAACGGEFDAGDDQDWYRLQLAPGDFYSVDARATSGLFFGNQWVEEWEGGSSSYLPQSSRAFFTAGRAEGDVAFGLGAFSVEGYDMTVDVAPRAAQNDCGSGHDADLARGEPVVVAAPGAACAGEFTTRGDARDDYVADLGIGDLVFVTVQGPSLTVTAPDGSRPVLDPVRHGGASVLLLPVDQAGRWTFGLGPGFGDPSVYTISFAIVALP